MANSPEYARMRESHCRTMAESATDPAVKRIHEELAIRYARQAAEALNAASAHAPGLDAEHQGGGMAARRERNAR
ncbi:hypothetical protein [Sphingosinicella soli]|uniref:Uncharacterized protein n=1 Tax=Sphingosinicella soli TaxID=333708 RepID=A0A7W7AY62_9SPHN|nr:hypothetical protein [Sphingosinicella soli]MBB4630553.1 hypothetical protein [Sphingosinicella soli]